MNAEYTGAQIAQRRRELGLTQKALAEQLHVTDKAVSKWERGINFPDLGLMESLARALETTPAALLGLDSAGSEEIVSSITKISAEQLEAAHDHVRHTGWLCFGGAVILVLSYTLFGSDVRKTQIAYQLLHGVILLLFGWSGYLLVRFDEIRRWDTADWLTFYGAAFPALLYLGIQFFTGHSPAPVLGLFLIGGACAMLQLLFYRIMRPPLVKALPAIGALGFALWHSLDGDLPFAFVLPALCCGAVWLICRLKKNQS